jgi:carbon-monoxide dehydrogenase large subunit
MSLQHWSAPAHADRRPRYLGAPLPSREARLLVRGAGRFVGDVRLPNLGHVAFVRSPHAHARIVSLDPSAAERGDGVRRVLLGRDALAHVPPLRAAIRQDAQSERKWLRACDWPCMATEKVSYVGEIVAAVLADDRYLAEDAAELVRVAYEPLRAVVDPEQALQPNSPPVRDELPDNVLAYSLFEAGDVDDAFARAALVVSDRFRTNRITALPMECRGIVAQYDALRDEMTIWMSTQAPHVVRDVISEALGLSAERVRVIAPNVGGGFGQKYPIYPEEIIVSLLALRGGGAVAWLEDRHEHLLAATHARDQVHWTELAADAEGCILGVRDRYLVDTGAYSIYPQTGSLEAFQTQQLMPGPYHIQHYRSECRAVLTHKTPGGAFRSISRPISNFIIESLLERVARSLDLDPWEVRRKNLIQPDEFPYRTATGPTIDSGSFVPALDLLRQMADPAGFRQEQRRARDQGRYIGLGFGCFTEATAHGSAPLNRAGFDNFTGYDSAMVSVDLSGHLCAALGVTSQGQSHETVFAQVLADEFGVGLDHVTIREGDTARTPFGMGSFGSRSAVVGSGSLLLAARRLKQKVLRIAAHLLEASPNDLELRDGRVEVRGVPERGLTLKEISRVAHYSLIKLPPGEEPGLVELARYEPPPATWSNGCQAAVVEVFPETGEVRLLHYYAVEDCGTVLNPLVVDAQVVGGIASGIGQALLEQVHFSADGQPLTASLMDYLAPTALDVPRVDLGHLTTPSPNTVIGVKGTGEGGPINPLAAIAIGVADAIAPLDPRLTETPFTPERVLRAIRAAHR